MLELEQWKRSFRLDVGSIRVESTSGALALRVAFSVDRDKTATPNNAEVAIWNLNPDHRAELEQAKNVTVRVEAGYQDQISQIFFGALRKAETIVEGPDYITRVSGGDGEDKLKFATISKTFAKGTSVRDVLFTLIDRLTIGRGNADRLALLSFENFGTKLEKPLTVAGPVVEELARFARSLGLEWSIQDGTFQIVKIGEPSNIGQGPKISPATGLIGSPRIDSEGKVQGRALILPDLLPGTRFRLESQATTGNFVCEKTRHFGDSRATEWYVDFLGKPHA